MSAASSIPFHCEGRYDPGTGLFFDIHTSYPGEFDLEPRLHGLLDSLKNAWKPNTLEQIINEQGGPKAADFEELYGAGVELWNSEEEFEQYMKILEHRETVE